MPDPLLISIVIPTLDGGATLDRALRSLVEQEGPTELIVVDGGSTDNSLDVIRRYASHIAWWCSEPDAGQSQAINKGLVHATGQICNWLCSDDTLRPEALACVRRHFTSHPDTQVLAGAGEIHFADGSRADYVESPSSKTIDLLPAYNGIVQQSCFWRRDAITWSPPLDEALHYAMDVDLWCRLVAAGTRWDFTPNVLSCFVVSGANKSATGGIRIAGELDRVYRRHCRDRVPLSFWYRHLRYPFERLLRRDRGPLRLGLLRLVQAAYILLLTPFYGYRPVRYMSWPE